MTNKLKFAVEDMNLLQTDDIDTNQFSLLKVDAFATGESLHGTFVTEETLRRTANTILLKPFVFAIDKRFDDLSSHVPEELPGGFVPHNSNIEFRKLSDGRIMMSCNVLIWKRYSGNLLEYFKRDGNRKSVSVEVEVLDSEVDPVSGLLELKNYVFAAITGLGDMIRSAIPNAQAVLVFSKEFEKDKSIYEEFSSKYEDLDFTIPPEIKNNANKALESKKGSSVALAMARFISANDKINPERIKQIVKFFKNKKIEELDEIVLGLYGGKESYRWSKELFEKIEEIDNTKLSYFGEEKSLEKEPIETDNNLLVDNYLGIGTEDETIDMADKEEKIEEEVKESEAEKKVEEKDPKAEEKEKEKKFSYAELFGMPEEDFAKMFAEDDEDDEDAKAKFSAAKEEFGMGMNPASMVMGLYALVKKMGAKMDKFSEDSKVYMAENEELKKFKSEKDAEQKKFAVEKTLREISERVEIPAEKKTEFIAESEKFEFANIVQWENDVKAACFDFKPVAEKSDKDIKVYAFANVEEAQIPSSDRWSNKIKE